MSWLGFFPYAFVILAPMVIYVIAGVIAVGRDKPSEEEPLPRATVKPSGKAYYPDRT